MPVHPSVIEDGVCVVLAEPVVGKVDAERPGIEKGAPWEDQEGPTVGGTGATDQEPLRGHAAIGLRRTVRPDRIRQAIDRRIGARRNRKRRNRKRLGAWFTREFRRQSRRHRSHRSPRARHLRPCRQKTCAGSVLRVRCRFQYRSYRTFSFPSLSCQGTKRCARRWVRDSHESASPRVFVSTLEHSKIERVMEWHSGSRQYVGCAKRSPHEIVTAAISLFGSHWLNSLIGGWATRSTLTLPPKNVLDS